MHASQIERHDQRSSVPSMQQCQQRFLFTGHFSRLLMSLTFSSLPFLRGHWHPLYESCWNSCTSCIFFHPPLMFFPLLHHVCSVTVWWCSSFRNGSEEGGWGCVGLTGWRVKGGAGCRKALLCGWPCQIDWWERQACVLGRLGIHPPGSTDTLI